MEFERYSVPPPPSMTGANPDYRAAPASVNHRHTESNLPQPEDYSDAEPPPGLRSKPSSPENLSSTQSEIFTQCSPRTDPNSAFIPTHSAKGDCEQGKGLVDKGQGAVHHLSTSNPHSASSPPASSYRPSGLAIMEEQRSPSPQFSPQRLSDKPPVSLQDDSCSR